MRLVRGRDVRAPVSGLDARHGEAVLEDDHVVVRVSISSVGSVPIGRGPACSPRCSSSRTGSCPSRTARPWGTHARRSRSGWRAPRCSASNHSGTPPFQTLSPVLWCSNTMRTGAPSACATRTDGPVRPNETAASTHRPPQPMNRALLRRAPTVAPPRRVQGLYRLAGTPCKVKRARTAASGSRAVDDDTSRRLRLSGDVAWVGPRRIQRASRRRSELG